MALPDLDIGKVTVGRVLAVFLGVSLFVGAWNTIGLPRWAWSFEVQAVQDFSNETRLLVLEDHLYRAQSDLTGLLRQQREYERSGEIEPDWLSDDIQDLRHIIYKKQKAISALEKTMKDD